MAESESTCDIWQSSATGGGRGQVGGTR